VGNYVTLIMKILGNYVTADTLVEPSRFSLSARPMFCTISTLRAAGVRETDRLHPALARDVDAFPEHANAGEERPVHAPVVRVDAVGDCRRTSRRSDTRWSPHSQAAHTRSGGTWRPASSP
jgi:hypothetical protein